VVVVVGGVVISPDPSIRWRRGVVVCLGWI